ncbi:hypothetical protein [Mangrovimonas spongiae]|uniref:DUF2490 domain-containing protein n=1 Tax=Mangrovimonas spongiae TaxID=2494697 RepID=A0A428JYU9_9FLAO|nr:hypothetical protein [Mangrovimonas spongiae]RSK39307.1 hypothetical protein EJA19_10285 [Mangrovimonas spongiae]
MGKNLFIIIFIFFPLLSFSQTDDLFLDLTVAKTFKDDMGFNYDASVSYKQIFDHPSWSRINASGSATYKYNAWSLLGGFTTQYIFDEEISNGLELRPWLGIGLKTKIIEGLKANQLGKVEWRNFIYDGLKNENYIRTTYSFGVLYDLDIFKLKHWQVDTGYTWYFLKDPARGERYANSREFRIYMIKTFTKSRISMGYLLEKYRHFNNLPLGDAHTFKITYTFL